MQWLGEDNISSLDKKIKIRHYIAGYISSVKKVFIVGQQDERIAFIAELLSKYDICQFIVGHGTEWENDLQLSQRELEIGNIDGIIIADAYCVTGYEKRLWLTERLDYVFEVPFDFFRKNKHINKEDVLDIFTPMLVGGRIGEIQFNLTDKCNLNCSLCSHFSPLVETEEVYNLESFEKDAKRITELTDHVDVIGLWGGESLLHPHLNEIIYLCRKMFPNSRIELGTNGLAVHKMTVSQLHAIKKTNCKVVVSGYPPTLEIWDEIKEYFDSFEILYRMTKVTDFFRHYDLDGNHEIFNNYATCCSKVCHTVLNGKYSSCYFPIVAHILMTVLDRNLRLVTVYTICMKTV